MRSRAMRKATKRYMWDRMKVSLWFVPLIMAVAAVLLSWLLSQLDERVPNALLINSKFFIGGTASEMRNTMLSIAGTVLATAGVVFSLLTLPLSTVAAQFGSRLFARLPERPHHPDGFRDVRGDILLLPGNSPVYP